MIEDTKKWVLSPERKAPKATREYTAKHLDSMLDKFLKTMQTTATRLQEKLLKPEARRTGNQKHEVMFIEQRSQRRTHSPNH